MIKKIRELPAIINKYVTELMNIIEAYGELKRTVDSLNTNNVKAGELILKISLLVKEHSEAINLLNDNQQRIIKTIDAASQIKPKTTLELFTDKKDKSGPN